MSRRNPLLSLVRFLTGASYRDQVRAERDAVFERAAREQAEAHEDARKALIAAALGSTLQLPTIERRRGRTEGPLMTRLQRERATGGRHG